MNYPDNMDWDAFDLHYDGFDEDAFEKRMFDYDELSNED